MLKTYALSIAAVMFKRLDSTKQLLEQHQNLSFGRFVEPAFKTSTPFQQRKPFRPQVNAVDFQERDEEEEVQEVENICACRRVLVTWLLDRGRILN